MTFCNDNERGWNGRVHRRRVLATRAGARRAKAGETFVIYKYVTTERIDIVENMMMRAAPYYELNDPYDCLFALDPLERERAAAKDDNYRAERATVKVTTEDTFGVSIRPRPRVVSAGVGRLVTASDRR